jgi:hypothetical protein
MPSVSTEPPSPTLSGYSSLAGALGDTTYFHSKGSSVEVAEMVAGPGTFII